MPTVEELIEEGERFIRLIERLPPTRLRNQALQKAQAALNHAVAAVPPAPLDPEWAVGNVMGLRLTEDDIESRMAGRVDV